MIWSSPTVNSMDFIARALRGWSVPLVLPVAQLWQSFDPDARPVDKGIAGHHRWHDCAARACQHRSTFPPSSNWQSRLIAALISDGWLGAWGSCPIVRPWLRFDRSQSCRSVSSVVTVYEIVN